MTRSRLLLSWLLLIWEEMRGGVDGHGELCHALRTKHVWTNVHRHLARTLEDCTICDT